MMSNPLNPNQTIAYLHAVARFIAEPQQPDGELRHLLREQYGIDARRLSRFTLLALLGALPLCQGLPENPAIYLASPFSSPSRMVAMQQKLAAGQPSPLDFMANLHNAATFQLAQILGSSGNSVFLAADAENCLSLLYAVLNALLAEPGQTVLLGWAYEQPGQGEQEGSVWWQVSGSLPPRQNGWQISTATINHTIPTMPHQSAFLPAVLALEEQLHDRGGLLLPPYGIWPALQIELLAADEIGKEA